tara:strand:- start:902 stop:1090 length:189 start_codon:yes stop_codon:yes gene_type:complete
MEKKESKKKVIKKVEGIIVSQSTKEVSFKASKNHKRLIKDEVYIVSENVAEILESKGLGKKI